MADRISKAAEPSALIAADDDIAVTTDYGYMWIFKGTRAQLEAEGAIPATLKWPERTAVARWSDGQVDYSLERTRPEGLKGPMRL